MKGRFLGNKIIDYLVLIMSVWFTSSVPNVITNLELTAVGFRGRRGYFLVIEANWDVPLDGVAFTRLD